MGNWPNIHRQKNGKVFIKIQNLMKSRNYF